MRNSACECIDVYIRSCMFVCVYTYIYPDIYVYICKHAGQRESGSHLGVMHASNCLCGVLVEVSYASMLVIRRFKDSKFMGSALLRH